MIVCLIFHLDKFEIRLLYYIPFRFRTLQFTCNKTSFIFILKVFEGKKAFHDWNKFVSCNGNAAHSVMRIEYSFVVVEGELYAPHHQIWVKCVMCPVFTSADTYKEIYLGNMYPYTTKLDNMYATGRLRWRIVHVPTTIIPRI